MKRPAFLALCVLAVACAALFLRRPGNGDPAATSSSSSPVLSVAAPATPASAHLNERRAAESQITPGALNAPAPVSSAEEKEQRLNAISTASTTYSPEGIRDIKPFLLDPDPEIRAAAKDGLINLGESGGSAALRAAAKQIKEPREAASYLDAADYLDLPAWSETEEAQVTPEPQSPAPDKQ
jgi:hypothetical protein